MSYVLNNANNIEASAAARSYEVVILELVPEEDSFDFVNLESSRSLSYVLLAFI